MAGNLLVSRVIASPLEHLDLDFLSLF